MKKLLFTLILLAIAILAVMWGIEWITHQVGSVPTARREPKKEDRITETINTTDMPLTLPEGFEISLFAQDLGAPRDILFDENGVLLASIPKSNRVVALPDQNDDGVADTTITVVENLNSPHGLALDCDASCILYIAETNQVASYDYDPATFTASNKRKILDLDTGGNHSSRSLLLLPDGRLLIASGSSCNVCVEENTQRAAITVVNTDGSNPSTFATGLRNAVFLALHPKTQDVWVTEMGRDLLGDDIPPDEVNIIRSPSTSSGQNSVPNFGWPYCYGKNIHDDDFDSKETRTCAESDTLPSHIDLQAHSAPLGLAFAPTSWQEAYADDLFVAYHGSWNRSTPTGYKIVRMVLDPDGAYERTEDFITGWQGNGAAIGRPVDLAFASDDALYLSDDKAGVVYRIENKNAQ